MLYHGKSIDHWMDVMRSGEKGRDEAGAVFLSIGAAAVPSLVKLLDHSEASITRACAASTLWLLRERAAEATAPLERILATDPDVVVRLRAAQALTGIAGPTHSAAVFYLRQMARSLDPTLAAWIKQDARLILKDAGISEQG